ncbi:hypothetical protein GCM10009530_22420 [Microbispora corallina]
MVGPAFVAAVQAAAAGQLGDGPLHDPAVPAQALAGLDPAAGDRGIMPRPRRKARKWA